MVFSRWVADENEAYAAALRMREVAGGGCTLDHGVALLLEECATTRRASTAAWYEGHLNVLRDRIPGDTYLHRITPEILGEYVKARLQDWAVAPERDKDGVVVTPGRRVKPATVNADLRALHRVFALAIRRGDASRNPVQLVTKPRVDRPPMDWFTADEFAARIARVTDEEAADLFRLIALSGVRRSEIARLRRQDVRLQARQLVVRGKTGTRTVPIADDLAPVLARVLSRAGAELVVDNVGVLDRAFRVWKRRLQDRRWHAHALRHTFGTALIRNGVRPDVVMRLMGHADIKTTMLYVHEVGADVVQAVQGLTLLRGGDLAQEQ
jgi:integrase